MKIKNNIPYSTLVELQVRGAYIPEVGEEYTVEELQLLNTPLPPQFQHIIDQMVLDGAKAEAEAYKPHLTGVDKEKQLQENAGLFEAYIRLSNSKEYTFLNTKWEAIRYRKAAWWSLFHEEMEGNWTAEVSFLRAVDKRMDKMPKGVGVIHVDRYIEIITSDGEVTIKPVIRRTVEQPKISIKKWAKFMDLWSKSQAYCRRVQDKRRQHTYSIYLKAKEATEAAKAFWKSSDGQRLNALNAQRSDLWNRIQELDVTFWDYNNLLNEEINTYWTKSSGENNNKLASDTYEALNHIRDEHILEMKELNKPAKGIGFWDFKQERDCREAHLHEEFKKKTMAALIQADEDYNQGFEAFLKSMDRGQQKKKAKKNRNTNKEVR